MDEIKADAAGKAEKSEDAERAERLIRWAGNLLDAAPLDGDNFVEAIAGGLAEKLGLSRTGIFMSSNVTRPNYSACFWIPETNLKSLIMLKSCRNYQRE